MSDQLPTHTQEAVSADSWQYVLHESGVCGGVIITDLHAEDREDDYARNELLHEFQRRFDKSSLDDELGQVGQAADDTFLFQEWGI